jgi:hypothetical protein
MFSAITQQITDGELQSFLLHWREHFTEDAFKSRYERHEVRIRSFILMRRKYLYIYFLWTIGRDLKTPETETARRWVMELSRYHEFRDVHEAQRRFYENFGRVVDELLRDTAPPSWLCDDGPPGSPSRTDQDQDLTTPHPADRDAQ